MDTVKVVHFHNGLSLKTCEVNGCSRNIPLPNLAVMLLKSSVDEFGEAKKYLVCQNHYNEVIYLLEHLGATI